MDTLRREREKLRKDNASLVAQLTLKTARENRLMEDYMRGKVRGELSHTHSISLHDMYIFLRGF